MSRIPRALTLLAAASTLCLAGTASAQSALIGWAQMPAATFSDGPTSGQFAAPNPYGTNLPPFVDKQPVQGFSGVMQGANGSYQFLVDNGFGAKANSADSLLRMYALTPDFRTATGGSGTVSAADWNTGALRSSFDSSTRVTLSDPDRKLGFGIVADLVKYPIYSSATNSSNPSAIDVAPSIRSAKLLTGADLDTEGVVRDKNGNLWFGEEFGPFLVKTDATGKVLRPEIPLAGVFAPENPYRGSSPANLGSSRGFEGVAINPARDRVYTLLEGTVTGDSAKTLRLNEFSVDSKAYTGRQWLYQLDDQGTNIGDMTAVNDHEFLVIERNGLTATTGGVPFKRVFRIDVNRTDGAGHVYKTEIVDLMNIADPHDLNGDGKTTFTFPYVTIENIMLLDAKTLLVVNDNNFPYGGGRALASDNTEFLKIGLASAVPEPGSWVLLAGGLAAVARRVRRGRA